MLDIDDGVDVEAFDRIVLETANEWNAAFYRFGLACDALDLEGVSVAFTDDLQGLAGVFRDGMIMVVRKGDLRDTALSHEVSHAILWRCPEVVQVHRVMACLVRLEPALGVGAQLNAGQCE